MGNKSSTSSSSVGTDDRSCGSIKVVPASAVERSILRTKKAELQHDWVHKEMKLDHDQFTRENRAREYFVKILSHIIPDVVDKMCKDGVGEMNVMNFSQFTIGGFELRDFLPLDHVTRYMQCLTDPTREWNKIVGDLDRQGYRLQMDKGETIKLSLKTIK